MTPTPDRLRLNGIRFYGHHGESREERTLGGRFIADVELTMDLSKAGVSDRIRDTVNYVRICEIVLETGEQQQFRLLEAMAQTMAKRILSENPGVEVRLRVRKLGPAIPAIMDSTEVEIVRKEP